MLHKHIAAFCLIGCTANAAAQLQEYSFDEPYRAPHESSFMCSEASTFDPSYEFMYFDIRLEPSNQPTGSFEGTFLVDGDCDAGGSFGRSIGLSSWCEGMRGPRSNSIGFAFAVDPIPTGIPLYDPSGNPTAEVLIFVGYQPGESVGPDRTFSPNLSLGRAPYHTDPSMQFGTQQDIDAVGVGDGIIIGIEITETDGVHYGWIEIHRAPDADPTRIDHCSEKYYITRYAYELSPGVPALVTGTPCPADTNGDGSLTPADFTAWVAAFNANAPECDQNDDGACTPADFTAWVANFNAGC